MLFVFSQGRDPDPALPASADHVMHVNRATDAPPVRMSACFQGGDYLRPPVATDRDDFTPPTTPRPDRRAPRAIRCRIHGSARLHRPIVLLERGRLKLVGSLGYLASQRPSADGWLVSTIQNNSAEQHALPESARHIEKSTARHARR